MNELPIYWLRKMLEQTGEYYRRQNKAMKGEHYDSDVKLTDEEKERRDRLLSNLDGLNYDEIKSDRVFG